MQARIVLPGSGVASGSTWVAALDCKSRQAPESICTRLREQAERALKVIGHMGRIPSKLGEITVSRKYIFLVAFLVVSPCFLVVQMKNSSLFIVDEDDFGCPPLSPQQDPGKALVESILRARSVASGSVDIDSPLQGLSPEGLKAWNDQHSCQSRGSNGLLPFYNRSTDQPAEKIVRANLLWDEVFDQYSNLHRECMHNMGDIGDYFLQKNSSSGCKFLVADVAYGTEFGEKILVLASSLLYAILTQRVILIPESTLITSYMCEPFAGSSWLLNSRSSFTPLSKSSRKLWDLDKATNSHRRSCSSSPSTRPESPYAAAAGIGMNRWQAQRFYCTREQDAYSETTFLYLSGLVYSVPTLFATPMFRPALEVLFPDRIVLTRLLRSAFLPGNQVWKRVKGIHHGYLQPANRLVGIELRYGGRGGVPRHKSMNKRINQRVTDCLILNDILPNITDIWKARALSQTKPSEPTPIKRVLISSLHFDLKDHLRRMYERNPTSTGEAVGVVQVSQLSGNLQFRFEAEVETSKEALFRSFSDHLLVTPMSALGSVAQAYGANQQFRFEADIEAFKEALLLSFSDHLLVTPMSALGSVAQAYGASTPWFIDVRKDGWFRRYGTCQRGQTIEVCDHFTNKYSCSSTDSWVDHGKVRSDMAPYIENCLTIDHDGGIQLITSPRS